MTTTEVLTRMVICSLETDLITTANNTNTKLTEAILQPLATWQHKDDMQECGTILWQHTVEHHTSNKTVCVQRPSQQKELTDQRTTTCWLLTLNGLTVVRLCHLLNAICHLVILKCQKHQLNSDSPICTNHIVNEEDLNTVQ